MDDKSSAYWLKRRSETHGAEKVADLIGAGVVALVTIAAGFLVFEARDAKSNAIGVLVGLGAGLLWVLLTWGWRFCVTTPKAMSQDKQQERINRLSEKEFWEDQGTRRSRN